MFKLQNSLKGIYWNVRRLSPVHACFCGHVPLDAMFCIWKSLNLLVALLYGCSSFLIVHFTVKCCTSGVEALGVPANFRSYSFF